MNNDDLKKFSNQSLEKFDSSGKLEMAVEGEWFRVRLTTRAGRHAARMWAYTSVGEDEDNDELARHVLDYVTREELLNAGEEGSHTGTN